MVGRLLRVTGTVLVIAVAFVTPLLATSTATPASADTVINGCTIVSNPTPTNFTNCSGAQLFLENLSGVDLSYANLSSAILVGADLSNANLSSANLTNAVLVGCAFTPPGIFGQCFPAELTGANLTGANLTGANFSACATNFFGQSVCGSVDLSGTLLVPSDQTVTATNNAGAVVTWATPQGLPGATPSFCGPRSGSLFLIGTTTVSCPVSDSQGNLAAGTFQVTVDPGPTTCTKLAGCDLAGLNLTKADFSFHDLEGANLMGANLSGDNLLAANLQDANLKAANLSGAVLTATDLTGANLMGANLSGANLFLSTIDSSTNLNAITWSNTTCPDGTNSDNDGGTCVGHL